MGSAMKASILRTMVMLLIFALGGIVQWSFAQVPDLEALERQLEERKAAARQQARRAEERCLQNRFEVASGDVSDCQQKVVWARADNGRDVNWPDATAYCRSLGPGWSLPSVSQLESLYAPDTPFSQTVSGYTIYPATNLIRFTGPGFWSAEAWILGLDRGVRTPVRHSEVKGLRALCVR